MRVRAHVSLARQVRRKRERSHVVEEDERPDHPPLGKRQDPPDLEKADAAAARGNDEREHGLPRVIAGLDPALDHAREVKAVHDEGTGMDRLIEGYRRFRAKSGPPSARAMSASPKKASARRRW